MTINVQPLFQPLQVRGLALANRIVMAPMTRNFSPGGVPGEDVAAYYRRRAEGGTGLLITEGVGIALDSLRASKVRAALTILGVAIGVMVVMVIAAMINGINQQVTAMLESTGPRTRATGPRRTSFSHASVSGSGPQTAVASTAVISPAE